MLRIPKLLCLKKLPLSKPEASTEKQDARSEIKLARVLQQGSETIPAAWALCELSHFLLNAKINFVLAQWEETSAPLLYEPLSVFPLGQGFVCPASDRTNSVWGGDKDQMFCLVRWHASWHVLLRANFSSWHCSTKCKPSKF